MISDKSLSILFHSRIDLDKLTTASTALVIGLGLPNGTVITLAISLAVFVVSRIASCVIMIALVCSIHS
jgi:hypothetical protein